jgi:hypothetical protein
MTDDKPPILCLHCGYDLRAATTNRCSECGQTFDPANFRLSSFPTENPGSLKFIRTLLTLLFAKKLSYEAFRDHSPEKAVLFRRINLVILLVGAAISLYIAIFHFALNPSADFQTAAKDIFQNQDIFQLGGIIPPNWLTGVSIDYLILMAAAIRGPLGIILQGALLFMLMLDWTHTPAQILSRKTASPKTARKSIILGCYASGFLSLALAFSAPGLLVLTFLDPISQYLHITNPLVLKNYGLIYVFISLLIPGALLLFRLVQWRRALHHLSALAILSTPYIALRIFLWRTLFWLFFIPLFFGLFRLILKF